MPDTCRRILSLPAGWMPLGGMIALSGQTTIFPFYHVVSDRPLPHIGHLYPFRDPSRFGRDLESLLRLFEPVQLEDYLDETLQGGRRPRMVLSFDDGLAECHSVIAPLLKKKGIPAIFFLNNRFIDNRSLFFRYRASILMDRVSSDREACRKAAEFLVVPEDQVISALKMVAGPRIPLLDPLASELGVDFKRYMEKQPVYMTTGQIRDLLGWGFSIGGHGAEHEEFAYMKQEEMVRQVRDSVEDLQARFGIRTAWFSFPFTSEGVPGSVIRDLLEGNVAGALFGTAGLKQTGFRRFIQRIPMESMPGSAVSRLKTEYLYYLLKMPLGRNHLRY